MSRLLFNTSRKRQGAYRGSMPSLANLSGYDTTFVSDFERQQVESYPGHLVAGRYYLRPASELGDQTFRSQSGAGFALGSNPYRTDGKRSHQPHWLFQDPACKPTPSEPILPPSPEADRLWRGKTEQKETVQSEPPIPQNILLSFFSLILVFFNLIPDWKIINNNYNYLHSKVEPIFNSFSSAYNAILFYLKRLVLIMMIFLTVPILWSIFYHTTILSNINHPDPVEIAFKPFQETINHLKHQNDAIALKKSKLAILNQNFPWFNSFQQHSISPEEIFASITRMTSKGAVPSEDDEEGFRNLRNMLGPVLSEISQGRFPHDGIKSPGSWQVPYSGLKGTIIQNDFTNILGVHPILNFLISDSATGSYKIRTDLQDSVKLDMSSLENELLFRYNEALNGWWLNNERPTGTSFLNYLQATLQPLINRNIQNLNSKIHLSERELGYFIMMVHSNLIKNSDLIYNNPILSKSVGDIYATLAAESIARSPCKELSLPPASQEDKIQFMKLALDVINLSNPTPKHKLDFALSINGAKLNIWGDDPFSKIKSVSPPPSGLKKRHVLDNNLEPGQCWGYSSNGGRLSYILDSPITLSSLVFIHPYSNNNINSEYGDPPTSFKLYALNISMSENSDDDSKAWSQVLEANLVWSQADLKVEDGVASLHAHFTINWPTDFLPPTHKFRIDLGPSHSPDSYSCLYHVAFHGALSQQSVFTQGLI